MNNAKLQLEVASPTSIKCGHIEWFALDTKLVGKVKALLEENKMLKENAINNDKVVDSVNWENRQLKDKINKALAYIERMTRIIDYDDDEFITWEHIIDIESILRGEEDES